MASCLSTMQDVHILLVEHDTNHLVSTKQLLEFFSYKVKCVEHASTALSILSNGKAQFDILMANIYSPPDACTFKLVQEAVKTDLLVILMCDYDDDMMARSALEQGAFLFLPKPIKMENVKYLWQHAWREKTWKIKEKEQPDEMHVLNRLNKEFGVEEEIPWENVTSDDIAEKGPKSRKNVRNREVWTKWTQELHEKFEDAMENVTSDDNDIAEKGPKSRKNVRTREVWTKWTQELHEKFEDAIIELGEGRCYPKEILEIMNVPGLTRLQVASHLQKCRKGIWRLRKERKRQNSNAAASQEIEATKLKKKKFGSMPVLTEHFEQQNLPLEENAEKIQEQQTSGLINNNVIDYHLQVQSKHDLSGYAFSEDNVEAPYMEPDGTLLITVPDAFMPIEQFIFDFNSVTSGNLQAIDIDQPNKQGSSERSTENEKGACLRWS